MFVKPKIQGVIIKLHQVAFIYKIASRKYYISNKYQTIIGPFKPSFAVL